MKSQSCHELIFKLGGTTQEQKETSYGNAEAAGFRVRDLRLHRRQPTRSVEGGACVRGLFPSQ